MIAFMQRERETLRKIESRMVNVKKYYQIQPYVISHLGLIISSFYIHYIYKPMSSYVT